MLLNHEIDRFLCIFEIELVILPFLLLFALLILIFLVFI